MSTNYLIAKISELEPRKAEILSQDRTMSLWYLHRLYERAEKVAISEALPEARHFGWLKHVYVANLCNPITDDGEKGLVLINGLHKENPFEYWKLLPLEAYTFLWAEASNEKSSRLKVHLLGALWESRAIWTKDKVPPVSVPELVKQFVDACVASIREELTSRGENKSKGRIVSEYLEVGAFLASKFKLLPSMAELVPEIIKFCRELSMSDAPHWAAKLCEIMAWMGWLKGTPRTETVITNAQVQELIDIAKTVQDRFESEPGAPPPNKVLFGVLSLETILNGKPVSDTEYFRRLGDCHKRRAEMSKFPGFVVGNFFVEAASAYSQGGMKELAAEMKAASRKVVGDSLKNGEMKKAEFRKSYTASEMEDILHPYFHEVGSAVNVLGRLSERLFADSIERGQTPKMKSFVFSLFPVQPIVDDRLKASKASESDGGDFNQKQTWCTEIDIANQLVLVPAFEKLRNEMALSQNDIVAMISHSPFLDDADIPFLNRGAKAFISGDYISAIHILVPRLEQFIRRILINTGLDATALRDGELRERPLGELLREASQKDVFPKELTELLQAVLSEEWGFNLRNRIAHGLAYPGECGYQNTSRIIHLFLLVSNLREIE